MIKKVALTVLGFGRLEKYGPHKSLSKKATSHPG
jgi:hypothetical protein